MEDMLLEVFYDNLKEVKDKQEFIRTMMEDAKEERTEKVDSQMNLLINDKKQLEEEMEKEKDKKILLEYNNDLEKVNYEIEKWNQNKLFELKELRDSETSINENIEFVKKYSEEKDNNEKLHIEFSKKRENLFKFREQAEIELNKLTDNGQKTFFGDIKPKEVIECENDLEKIEKELNKLDTEEKYSNEKFGIIEEKFKKLCEENSLKLNLKKEKLKSEIIEQKQEQEKKKEEQNVNEQEEKQGEIEKTEDKQENKQEEKKEDNQEKPQEKTKSDTPNYETPSTSIVVSKKKNENKKVKITIGSNGRVEFDGITTKINSRTFKEGTKLNSLYKGLQINDLMDIVNKNYSEDIVNLITDSYNYGAPIDFTIINSIDKAGIDKANKESLIKGYLTNTLKAHYEYNKEINPLVSEKLEKYKDAEKNNNMEIVYDMKDLSKSLPFWKVLFSLHPERDNLTIKEKERIVELSDKAQEYGLGRKEGEFKYNTSIFTKILGVFKKNKNLLPEAMQVKKESNNLKSEENHNETKLVVEKVKTPMPTQEASKNDILNHNEKGMNR